MKPQASFHEILLFAGTAFSQRQYSRKDTDNNSSHHSPMEEMERACWDGILYELFPDIFGSFSKKCESFIWHVMSGKNFLNVSIGPVPPVINNETTIDPYFLLTPVREN